MNKIIFISDTHNKHQEVQLSELITDDVDTIIHCGDCRMMGHEWELRQFLDWFNKIPVKNKIFIAGNHDWIFDRQNGLALEILKDYPDIIYLQHQEVIIDGVKIFGSPYSPFFHNWAFNVYRGDEIKRLWNQIPNDTDILLTHGPAFGMLDQLDDGTEVGCEDLLYRITEIKPKIHACGHIHSGQGTYQGINTLYINGAVLNEQYRMQNPPLVIDYRNI